MIKVIGVRFRRAGKVYYFNPLDMDITTGTAVAKTVVDLMKNENVLNKSVGVLGMLFPFAGLKQKAVEMYVEDIEKWNSHEKERKIEK